MKKTLLAVLGLIVTVVLASAFSNSPSEARIGYQAPNFTVTNGDTTLSLQDLRGKYVKLTFWSSTNAESRIALQQTENDDDVVSIAVNLDPSEGVFGEICKLDGLRSETQFHVSHASSDILKAWQQGEELSTFVIDPQGIIVAQSKY